MARIGLLVALVLLMGCMCVAAGHYIRLPGSFPPMPAGIGPAPTTVALGVPPSLPPGATAADGGYSLSVVAMEDPARPEWDPWYLPEPRTKLTAVEIVVGCVTCEGHRAHPRLAVLEDADGVAYMAELGALERHNQLSPTTLGPGEYARGRVGFELPEGAVPARTMYLAPGVTLQVGLVD
jgi:hypothetical protein